jgi:large conductance mechanosensitive channel
MKIFAEFRRFIENGRVLDLAIAVVMGGAFNAIVASVVNDLIMPLLSVVTLGTKFSELYITLGSGPNAADLTYGNFIGAVVHFVLIAIVIFIIIKIYNQFAEKKVAQPPATKKCPYCATAIATAAVRCLACTTLLKESAVPVALR